MTTAIAVWLAIHAAALALARAAAIGDRGRIP